MMHLQITPSRLRILKHLANPKAQPRSPLTQAGN